MKGAMYRLLTVVAVAAMALGAQEVAAQSQGDNGAGKQDQVRSQLRQHEPGTGTPANQVKKQLRTRQASGNQPGPTAGPTAGATALGQGGKKYGPGDGTGNQGVGPRDGSGYGPGTGTMSGTGSQRRAGNRGRH